MRKAVLVCGDGIIYKYPDKTHVFEPFNAKPERNVCTFFNWFFCENLIFVIFLSKINANSEKKTQNSEKVELVIGVPWKKNVSGLEEMYKLNNIETVIGIPRSADTGKFTEHETKMWKNKYTEQFLIKKLQKKIIMLLFWNKRKVLIKLLQTYSRLFCFSLFRMSMKVWSTDLFVLIDSSAPGCLILIVTISKLGRTIINPASIRDQTKNYFILNYL